MRKKKKRKPRTKESTEIQLLRFLRKGWQWYGWNRVEALRQKPHTCNLCGYVFPKGEKPDVDHIEPVGLYNDDLTKHFESLFFGKVQLLCKSCHDKKTIEDRNRIKEKRKCQIQ